MWDCVRRTFAFEPMAALPGWIHSGEETANYLTHLPGAIASLVGFALLMLRASRIGDVYRTVSYCIFGASMVNLYWMSTAYHFSTTESIKRVLRYGDHISIYCLIAGSYTPFTLITMREGVGWIIFWIIWSIAALGIFLKILKFDGFNRFTVLTFIGMGWCIVFATKDMIEQLSTGGLYWVAFGGVMYTFGTFFYSKDEKIAYYHAIWHLYVLAGSFAHFVAIYFYT
jgi:hemolysin III